jgi:Secretory lipase
LLYRTTNATGQPVATVATLMVPTSPAPGARKLVSYQTFYDSLTLNCAPSYTMRGGNNGGSTQPLESEFIGQELQQGWEVVVPDYEGPQSEWAVGPMLGRATLDGIRAVESFAPAGLEGGRTPVGMNG